MAREWWVRSRFDGVISDWAYQEKDAVGPDWIKVQYLMGLP